MIRPPTVALSRSSPGSLGDGRPGVSSHGLRFADLERAFAEAERLLGSWARVRPHQALAWKRVLPVAVIEKAAEILGVEPRLLMSREY